MHDRPKNPLERYFLKQRNSHSRESILNNKLFFDLKLAAAKRGYFLNLYVPEVDQDGFDIILDDKDRLVKLQLKTVMKIAGTSEWTIHKELLRPERRFCEQLGFEMSPVGTGYQGGVILMEIDAEDEFIVNYYFTDIIVLRGIKEGIINLSRPPTAEATERLFKALGDGPSHDKATVTRGMFIRAKDASGLLALIGLHSLESSSNWRHQVLCLVWPCKDDELPAPRKALKRLINDAIARISRDSIRLND